MNQVFREVLLSSSRVIWPAEPARAHTRVTIHTDARLALTRVFVGLVAYSNAADDAARNRFVAGMEHLTAAGVSPEERPPELRHLPRQREVESSLRRGVKRFRSTLEIAARLSNDVHGASAALAAIRTSRRSPSAAPIRPREVLHRTFEPALPVIHLAIPLVAGEHTEIAERYPELVAAAAPSSFPELITCDKWVFQAIDAAERWRQALPADWDLIEVRAHWIGSNNYIVRAG